MVIEQKTANDEEAATEAEADLIEVADEDTITADPTTDIEAKDNKMTKKTADKAPETGKAPEMVAATTEETDPTKSTTDSSDPVPEETIDTKNKNKEEEVKEGQEAPTKEVAMIGTRRETMMTELLTGEEPTTTKGAKTEGPEDLKGSTKMMIDPFDSW